jgi:hypothetical protein
MQFVNPVHPPGPEVTEPCQAMSSYARRRVCVFLANGVDPLCLGNLSGVRQYLHALGFTNTYYGYPYHGHWFKKELCRVRKDDPDARFVLIGYGMGADTLRAVARSVCQEGVAIDLFISLQGNPEGCLSAGLESAGCAGACPLPEEQMLGAPTDPRTLHVLAEELIEVASRVPLVLPPTALPRLEFGPGPTPPPRPPEPDVETAPQPRPLNPGADSAPAPRAERTVLQAVPQLTPYTLPEQKIKPNELKREYEVQDEDEDDEPETAAGGIRRRTQ